MKMTKWFRRLPEHERVFHLYMKAMDQTQSYRFKHLNKGHLLTTRLFERRTNDARKTQRTVS